MHNEQDFEQKKRLDPMPRIFRFTGIRNSLLPVQVSPKSKRDLHTIATMWDTSSLATHEIEKDHLSLPRGTAKDRNGPLTGRRPDSKKDIILTSCTDEMGDAHGVAKKSGAAGRERGQYCKSFYWKQKVYNINYSRMQNTRQCVQRKVRKDVKKQLRRNRKGNVFSIVQLAKNDTWFPSTSLLAKDWRPSRRKAKARVLTCFLCGKPGHIKAHCPKNS